MDNLNVVLVDSNDTRIGIEEKYHAHQGSGILHRAVSVLVFRVVNKHVETLIQKRSYEKLVWPGFWTNTICTHPMENETYQEAGARRLNEEMGIRISPELLTIGFQFEYQAQYSPEFSEHELDTVLFLLWDGNLKPDKKEADDAKWIAWNELLEDMQLHRATYTPWFHQIVSNKKTSEYIKTL